MKLPHKTQGIILIWTMLFIFLISLAIVESFDYLERSQASVNFFKTHSNLQDKLDIWQNVFIFQKCEITYLSNTSLMQKSIEWWNRAACHEKHGALAFYFVYMFIDDCACLLFVNSQTRACRYKWIGYIVNTNSGEKIWQQRIIVAPCLSQSYCLDKRNCRSVLPGLISKIPI